MLELDPMRNEILPWAGDASLPGEEILSGEVIARRVAELAKQISCDLAEAGARHTGEPRLDVLAVMSGSLFFAADLLRQVPLRFRLFCVSASSYHDARHSSGVVKLDLHALPARMAPEILIIDDILDTGLTLAEIVAELRKLSPHSRIRSCVLLRKLAARRADVSADYVGFDVPNRFVVGYGLDDGGYFRNLPCIRVLD